MTEPYFEWAMAEERGLARYVREDLPAALGFPTYINRLDLGQVRGITGVVDVLYDLLRQQGIGYDLAPFHPRVGVTQRIRKPETLLAEKRGTCLELAVVFAGMCLASDLLPLVVAVDGHAFAAICRTQTRRNPGRRPKALAFDRGVLRDLGVLRELARADYLLLECTGAAQSTAALDARYPEGRGRGVDGYMSFERACEAGQEQVARHIRAKDDSAEHDKREFLYALDIHDLQVNRGIEPGEEDGAMGENRKAEDERQVDTGGGAFVGGSVNTGGGDFTGRDRTVQGNNVGGDSIHVGNITGGRSIAIGRNASSTVHTTTASSNIKIDAQQLRAALEELWGALDAMQLPRGQKQSATSAASDAIDSIKDEGVDGDAVAAKVKQVGATLRQANTVIEAGSSLWRSVQRLAPLLGPMAGGAQVVTGWFGVRAA